MSVVAALIEGVRLACRHWRALLVIYAINLVVAGVIALPVYHAIDANLARTESAERMAGGFDWLWYQEFVENRDPDSDAAATVAPWQQGAAPMLRNFERYVSGSLRHDLPPGLFWASFAYLIVATFLTGGVLGLFAERNARFSFRFFFDRAGRYFLILIGILVVAQVLYWFLWEPIGSLLNGFVAYLRRDATTEWTPTLVGWLVSLILMVLAFAIHMTMNYARVAAVAWEKLGLIPAVLGAMAFTLKNIGKALALFYLTALIPLATLLLYALLSGLGSGRSGFGLVVMALIQQGFILTMIWTRMVYLGSQMSFYRGTMNMPDWVTPAGPPPTGDEDELVVEEATLFE
jgi:hypothetical protein